MKGKYRMGTGAATADWTGPPDAVESEAVTATHVLLLSVPVSDQDAARDFYLDALGFELVRDEAMGPTMRWVQVAPRGGQTALTLVTWFPSMPAGSLKGLVLETDDLDGDAARLAERGVPVEGGIQEAPWGRYLQLADPDGNGLVLQSSTGRGRWS
jgi:catechol 2,3-dioxygenase-like lactoylglutathione lyase family enzyme